ncbi:hypothetical protein [Streptomyces sp. NPDC058623]|uniref:hypothetical protein n=1 Tax=Streptomyces sp. NPDC058623 TaxID=3346563 RepID=UPI00364D6434
MPTAGEQQQNVGRRQVLKLATGAVGRLALTTSAFDVLGGAPEEAKPPALKPLWTWTLLDKDGSGKGLDQVVHQDGVPLRQVEDGRAVRDRRGRRARALVRDGLAYANPPDNSLAALDLRTDVVRWSAPREKSGAICTLDAFAAGLLFGRNGNIGIGSKPMTYDLGTGGVR